MLRVKFMLKNGWIIPRSMEWDIYWVIILLVFIIMILLNLFWILKQLM